MASAVAMSRQWRTVAATPSAQAAVKVFNVVDETKAVDTPKEGAAAVVDGEVTVTVHELATGRKVVISAKPDDKTMLLMTKAAKALGVASTGCGLVCQGRKLEDTDKVARVVAGGGHAALVKMAVELLWDPDCKTPTVVLSDDCKTMWAQHGGRYCYERNIVRSQHPLPTSGVTTFRIQLAGSETGCYDAIALCTEDYDASNENRRLGNSNNVYSYELCNGRSFHASSSDYKPPGYMSWGTTVECTYDAGAGTLHMRGHERGGTYTGGHEEPCEVFSGLPSEPLYVVVNVCGHARLNRLRIIDDSSRALVDDDEFQYDGGDDGAYSE